MTTRKRKEPSLATKREDGKASETISPVLAFLSGAGPCPLPEEKRAEPCSLEAAFVTEAEAEIAQQDKENDERSAMERRSKPVASL